MLLISFILHIVTICGLYLLYKQVQKKEQNIHEIDKLFHDYLTEVKEENKRLSEMLKSNTATKNVQTIAVPHTSKKLVKDEGESKDNEESIEHSEALFPNEALLNNEEASEVEMSLQAQVLQLHYNGLSNEEIARKLDCGKTEVELFIKLHEKKEP